MSARANIIVVDEYGEELIFYRHSDGYPEGAMPILRKFMQYVSSGIIRNNTSQASGWLILFGAEEYGKSFEPNKGDRISGWKCGSIEPATEVAPDVEYIYTIDLSDMIIRGIHVGEEKFVVREQF